MQKIFVLLALSLAGILSGGCAAWERPESPPVVEIFACGDYCPGPAKQYLKRVYDGVEDAETCKAVGGKPYTYFGWGQRFLCLAE